MSLKAYLVNLEKEITIKIPAELSIDGCEVIAVFKKGDGIIKADWGKFWGEIETEILKLEAQWPGLTVPVHGIEVSIADPQPTDAQGNLIPIPIPTPSQAESPPEVIDPIAARGPEPETPLS